ncbi:MAG: UvrB/UvrC motif-containing protein [Phycisphaerales bacterium]|jgi:hypothetical protein|nr:UvrB/UvrC motif-containing protein [Phycisphaerales bacterium]
MGPDIGPILSEWPFEPGRISVRIVQTADGEPRIQVRLDLGILQMHVDGRPDGQRPDGFESLLEMHTSEIDASREGDVPGEPVESDVRLSPEDCRALREEAVQYYHRYVALLVVNDFERVVRDTTRNLRVLDLCRDYGREPSDRAAMEQFRPYIMIMRSRALASLLVQLDEPKAAILALDEGLDTLRGFYQEHGIASGFDESAEVQMLRGMREALMPKLPVSQSAELRSRLQKAIEQENYELAAILRDELRQAKG